MNKLIVFSFCTTLVVSCSNPKPPTTAPQNDSALTVEPAQVEEVVAVDKSHTEWFAIPAKSTTFSELRKLDFTAPEILELVSASKSIHSLERIPAGTKFSVTWSDDTKTERAKISFATSKSKRLEFDLTEKPWTPSEIELPISKLMRTFTGTVTTTLWDSASSAGMAPSLIPELAEIFAWQVDFSREVQPGDRWRLVVEEKFIEDEAVGWGPVLAAQFHTKSGDKYTGIRFAPEGESASYFQEDGSSLKRMFLKSPLKFGRISSRFSKSRFHPILKYNRPHNGVDYAAPIGTPVRTVGDGRVTFVGRNGGSGKMIKIRHNSVYTTAYLHLNGYAKNLRRGSKVEQGQVIGYVGNTGLSTGPHLHFSFYKHGRFVDPLGVKFPSADPVPESSMTAFASVAQNSLAKLPEWNLDREFAQSEEGEMDIFLQ